MNPIAQRLSLFGVVFTLLTVLTIAITPQHALAWTHEQNNWDVDQSDYTCGYDSDVPCLYWRQPNGQSTTLYASFDGSLSSGSYDFTSRLRNTFNDFNSAPALNPYLYQCSGGPSCQNAPITYLMSSTLGAGVYGATDIGNHTSPVYDSGKGQWYALFNYTITYFSSTISWNDNLQFDNTHADGRKVATHETGHVQGLGHTSHDPAIMRQGAVGYYTLQDDDKNGLSNIYPGYYPA